MKPKLQVCDVWKAYPTPRGPISVLEGVDLSVAAGEFVAVIGSSGCGKSTLITLMAGFDVPDRGGILVDGKPVSGPSRNGILIFQRGSLFPWLTIRRNLEFGLDGAPAAEKRRLVDDYLRLVGLRGFDRAFPRHLSGGMLQRAELARALIAQPEVLYMDEPFAALDALTRLRMRAELLRILSSERHTVLMVTHDVEEAIQLADRIFLLSDRPAKVQCVFDVALPRPRVPTAWEAVQLKRRILAELGIDDAAGETPA
jgi:ABC-type nitrate/sulfonate/bicarbonate transport system ATPase subunit